MIVEEGLGVFKYKTIIFYLGSSVLLLTETIIELLLFRELAMKDAKISEDEQIKLRDAYTPFFRRVEYVQRLLIILAFIFGVFLFA